MPLSIAAPIVKDFVLERSDILFGNEGEPTTVTIKQASMLDVERRAQATEKRVTIYQQNDLNSVREERQWNYPAVMRLEAYLTLVSSNITDGKGEPVFRSVVNNGVPQLQMSEAAFTKAWGNLPPEVADEIHECVLKQNPTWGYVPADGGES